MQGNNGQYPDFHRHILKGLLSLINTESKKLKTYLTIRLKVVMVFL